MDKTQKETILLLALDILGVGWLAKDTSGVLSAYVNEPYREEVFNPFLSEGYIEEYAWENSGGDQIDFFFRDGILEEVKATDETPTRIENLLMRKAVKLSEERMTQELIEVGTKKKAQILRIDGKE